MKLKTISLENFFGHKLTKLDLTLVSSPLLIVGGNGVGKSSLCLEALSFCIFGKTRVENVDSIIYHDTEEMSVICEFEVDGQNITIERSKRRHKAQKLFFYLEGIRVDELLTETQVRINKLFGISYEAFISSTFLKQNEAHAFLQKNADERKQIIGEILNLGLYEQYEDVIKSKRSEIKNTLKENQAILEVIPIVNVSNLESDLKRLNKIAYGFKTTVELCEKELEEAVKWNSLVKEKNQTYEKVKLQNEKVKIAIEKANTSLNEKMEIVAGCEKFLVKTIDEKQVNDLEETLAEIDARITLAQEIFNEKHREYNEVLHTEVERVNTLLNAISKDHAKIESSVDALNQKIHKLSKVDSAQCPTCLRDLTKEAKDSMLKDLQHELRPFVKKQNELSEALADLNEEKAKARSGDFKVCLDLNREVMKVEDTLVREKMKRDTSKVTLKNLQSDLQVYKLAKEKRLTILESIVELKSSLKTFQEQIQPLPEKTLDFKNESSLKVALEEKNSHYQEALELKTKFELEIERGKENLEHREKLLDSLKTLKSQLDILERLAFAFSRKGIPAKIIAQSLPDIENFANVFLDKISNGNLEIKFSTIKQLKSNEERETLEISVSDGITTRPFASYSGGEALRISLALRLALSRFLTYRQGSAKIDMLIIDEPSGLDVEGLEQFATALKKLKDTFSLIVVITHLQDLQAQFDNVIQLQKTPEGIRLI